jgi:hypothetical protein
MLSLMSGDGKRGIATAPVLDSTAILIMKSGCSYSPHEVPFSALYRRPDLD